MLKDEQDMLESFKVLI